jgi:FtsH-binding integral membrane protein
MYNQRWGTVAVDQATIDEALRAYMLRVYNMMGSGLLLSGVVAIAAFQLGWTAMLFKSGLGIVAMLAPIGLLLVMSFGVNKLSPAALQGLYWAFTATMGLSLSSIFMVYTGASIARVFFITAATFGVMSLYGYTTKRSLANFGSFLMMGLVGIMLASIVNIFLGSSMLQFVVSVLGVLIFTGLIAYDTQRIKEEFNEADAAELQSKQALMAAVNLYLNFINLFQMLLSLLGNRE